MLTLAFDNEIEAMRFAMLFLVVFGVHVAFTQSLKKKYIGTFEGMIPAYSIYTQDGELAIDSAKISIEITVEGKFIEIIDGYQKEGELKVKQTSKSAYELNVRFPNQVIVETFFLFKKEGVLERKGIAPQPSVFLKRRNK